MKTRAPRSRSASKRTVESTTRPLETLRGPGAARERFRSDAIPLVQAALAADLAWFVAHDLAGHPAPIFAPIGALLILSDAPGRRTSRVLAATLGAVIGIALGDALVSAIGKGAIQVTVVAVLAMSATAVLGASPAVVTNGHRGGPNRRRPAPARFLQPGRSAATRRCPDRRCDEPGGLVLVIMFALIELPLPGLVLMPDRTRSLAEKLNVWMTAHRQTLIVIVAGAGGAYLLISGLTDLS